MRILRTRVAVAANGSLSTTRKRRGGARIHRHGGNTHETRLIRMVVLLLLGTVGPTYAQQEQQQEDKRQKQEQKPKPEKQQEAKPQKQKQQQEKGQQKQQQANRPSQQEQHGQPGEQQAAWEGHRAHEWKSEHRDWNQRGGYNGYRIPEDRYRGYFGPSHAFRIYSYPHGGRCWISTLPVRRFLVQCR